ncbi:MAG TPA: class I SAM-dependent methyltransferase [Fimbriimonadaceae bacterium]|nr:class I SAM-dependent methyltransferase [Fimbriimonadaceae bacterium]
MPSGFFFSANEDEQLEASNSDFWESLIEHVQEDCGDEPPRSILDIGCHFGGLLSRIITVWNPREAWGIEPMALARRRANARLHKLIRNVRILDVADWPSVPEAAIDLVTCHEVLYLEPDLHAFMANINRVLSRSGHAYIVLGCHAENPVWAHWKPRLAALGHQVYDHRPMDILAAGAAFGLHPSLRPLRKTGWITHDPIHSEFTFPSASVMLDHHFKHKLVFRFMRS